LIYGHGASYKAETQTEEETRGDNALLIHCLFLAEVECSTGVCLVLHTAAGSAEIVLAVYENSTLNGFLSTSILCCTALHRTFSWVTNTITSLQSLIISSKSFSYNK